MQMQSLFDMQEEGQTHSNKQMKSDSKYDGFKIKLVRMYYELVFV